jgi:predicted O-methyltransferase YrrM/glycosyltransferase involved in cell wall biosynthesis
MMVKNEAELIKRAIDSARPLIDCWSITDTGSTDGTQDIIRKELADIPGHLWERPWVNWGHNRTEAITLAKLSGADFMLLLDADQKVSIEGKFTLEPGHMYWSMIKQGSTQFQKPFILDSKNNWYHVGVTHEYLTCDPEKPISVLLPVSIVESGRLKPTEYFVKDAAILEEELKKDPKNARNVFYLAQSYRDARQLALAIDNYKRRVELGGWHEEVWYSLYQIAQLGSQRGNSADQVIANFLKAYEYYPKRSESLGALAMYLRQAGKWNLDYMVSEQARKISTPADRLFLDQSFYDWRCKDEFAIAAYWTERYKECLDVCNELLLSNKLPQNEIDRVVKNRQFAIEKLPRKIHTMGIIKSFDLFDTLVAARSGCKAGDAPVEELFPIVEVLNWVKTDDCIISDYLDTEKAHKVEKEVLHLDNKLIVTPSGKWDGTVWSSLNPKPVVHIGDHSISDIIQPLRNGIDTEITLRSRWTEEEQQLQSAGFPSFAGAVREARLTFPIASELAEAQIRMNVPFLFMAALYFHRLVMTKGIENLLISSRDGCLWVEMQKWVRNQLGANYDVWYYLTSRVARVKGDLEYTRQLAGDKKTLIVDMGGTGKTLKALLNRLGMDNISAHMLINYIGEHVPFVLKGPGDNTEHANLALHPMVADVKDGKPVYFNPSGIDWEHAPQITIQHEAFRHAMKCFRNYSFTKDLQADDEAIYRMLKLHYDRIMQRFPVHKTVELWRDEAGIQAILGKTTPQNTYDLHRAGDPLQVMYDYSPYLREVAKGNVLEIGTEQGISTAAFLVGVEKNGGHVYSVDILPQYDNIYDHPQWTFIHTNSVVNPEPVYKVITEPIDVLMIDGDHHYESVMADLKNYMPLVKPGGLILMHDVAPCDEVRPKIIAENWFPIDGPRHAYDDFLAAHPTWKAEIRPGRLGLGVITKGD